MENQEFIEEESTISLTDIVAIVKKRFWFLVTTTILGGLLLAIYAFAIATPKYQSIGAIMVQVRAGENGSVNTVESQRLVQSTVDILTKIDLVPSKTAEVLNLQGYDITAKQVRDNMGVSNTSGSLLIQITFISEDPELAKIANETIILTLINITDAETYNMAQTLKGNLSNLYVSEAKYHSPNKILFTFVGLLLGGVVGLVIVFAFEMINTGYKTKEEIEKELKIQVIGEIPEYEVRKG